MTQTATRGPLRRVRARGRFPTGLLIVVLSGGEARLPPCSPTFHPLGSCTLPQQSPATGCWT